MKYRQFEKDFNKERLITPKRIIAADVTTGKTIWLTDKIFPQHFYPLSIKE